MAKVLRITDWGHNFETHESRKLKRLEWVSVPNDLLDLGYRRLIDHPEGAAHFAAWIVIVEIASMCKVRGTLSERGISLSERDLSLKSGLPVDLFKAAIPRLLETGWLEEVPDVAGDSPAIPGENPVDTADSREVAGKTSAYRDRDIDTYKNTKTICSSDDEQDAAALKLVPQKPKPTDEVKVWFDTEFWPTYPRKKAKPQALKAARRHAKTATDRTAIMECLTRRLPALQAQFRADGDYRPYPASWLNQQPWNDPQEAERPAAAHKPAGGGVLSAIEEATATLYGQEGK